MNDMLEKNELEDKTENDFEAFQRGAYRRGARRKTKGNFTLFLVVAFLSLVVIAGLVVAVKTFMPATFSTTGKSDVSVTQNDAESQTKDYEEFKTVISGYERTDEAAVKSLDGIASLDKGPINYCKADMDSDGKEELIMLSAESESEIALSVYEYDAEKTSREAYCAYSEELFESNGNLKCEIYVSEGITKPYLCIEKYCADDGSWSLELLSYDGSFKHEASYSDDISDSDLAKYGLVFCGDDYSEGTEIKMNSDTAGKTLIASFEVK